MDLSEKGEIKMKEIMKRGICVTLIYFVAILCTLMLSNRIERLESVSFECYETGSSIK